METVQLSAERYAEQLAMPVESLALIQRNKYCAIYQMRSAGHPLILKAYLGDDAAMMRREADGARYYQRSTADDPAMISAGVAQQVDAENLLCLEFVSGQPFNALIYQAARDERACERALTAMRSLGRWLARVREQTQRAGEAIDPFAFEYIAHCSRRLREHKLFGRTLFGRASEEASALCAELETAHPTPSFAHGDLVFLNIHVDGERVGLIDFANNQPLSHPLNDLHNLRVALNSMLIPARLRTALWDALLEGLGPLELCPIADRFYHEFHRRRWLMLQLCTRSPLRWLRALAGLRRFAGPHDERNVATSRL